MDRTFRLVLRRFKDVPEDRLERTNTGQSLVEQYHLRGLQFPPPLRPLLRRFKDVPEARLDRTIRPVDRRLSLLER